MDCNLTNISAVWNIDEPKTPIDSNGKPIGTVESVSTGYYCDNCGNGFGDWAGCLAHIVNFDVPNNKVDEAVLAAQDITVEAEPDYKVDKTDNGADVNLDSVID